MRGHDDDKGWAAHPVYVRTVEELVGEEPSVVNLPCASDVIILWPRSKDTPVRF